MSIMYRATTPEGRTQYRSAANRVYTHARWWQHSGTPQGIISWHTSEHAAQTSPFQHPSWKTLPWGIVEASPVLCACGEPAALIVLDTRVPVCRPCAKDQAPGAVKDYAEPLTVTTIAERGLSGVTVTPEPVAEPKPAPETLNTDANTLLAALRTMADALMSGQDPYPASTALYMAEAIQRLDRRLSRGDALPDTWNGARGGALSRGLKRCEANARKGTGTGVCWMPLDSHGQCGWASDHIDGGSL